MVFLIGNFSQYIRKCNLRKRTTIGTLVLITCALTWTTTERSFGANQAFSIETPGKREIDVERFGPLWSSLYGGVVDYSPDGNRIAVGGSGVVFILNAKSYQMEKQLFGHTGYILSIKWSPDGNYVASGALESDNAVKIWEIESGEQVGTFPGTRVTSIAWSPDGTRLAYAIEAGGLLIWEIETRRRILERLIGGDAVAWSPDSRYIAAGFSLLENYGVRIYEVATGNLVREFRGHTIYLRGVAWSPDGRYVASCADWDRSAKIWDVGAGRLVKTLIHDGGPTAVAWSPDGGYLAVGGGFIWETETWTLIRSLGRGQRWLALTSISWSPDGDYLVSGGWGVVNVWDVEAGTSIVSLRGHRNEVGSLTWSPDGRYIASVEGSSPFGEDNISIKIWDTKTGNAIRTFCEGLSCGYISSVEWSPNGRYLAYSSSNLILLDTDTWREVRRIQGFAELIRWSPDGKYLAGMHGRRRTIDVWEAETGDLITTIEVARETTPRLMSIAWSPDGNYLASSAHNPDSTVKIWEVGTWELVATFQGLTTFGIRALTWSPDSQYVAGIEGTCCVFGDIRIWELETGNLIRTIGRNSGVVSLMWSPDGKYLAAGDPTKTIKIWEAETGNLIRTLLGHADSITSVRWSPDGRYLASGSSDRTVRVWGERSEE